ncbi:amidohydrolase family protein [Cellulomonas sp. JH27-2]|uniref:amidohydrolase family protein n=1 Tax=Cellulomonas sp. JH27-2 TaxID=2774139 RepID=UPI00177D765F|nr:amidohydrolase family protein [Cellulomonas sp. JH27-2]
MPRIIDAHAHLWDTSCLTYPWLADEPDLPDVFGPADLHRAAPEIDAYVFIEADAPDEQAFAEAARVASLPDEHPRLAGIVACAPLEQPDAEAALARLEEIERVVGVRRLLQGHDDAFFELPALAAGLRAVARRGWTFDACVHAGQLPAVVGLARRHPDLIVVLDHLGKPDVHGGPEAFARWRTDLAALAELPNVVVKLSGLPAQAGAQRIDLAPWLRAAVDLFGPQRAMLGSDWPVSSRGPWSLPDWIDTVRTALGPTGDEWDAIAAGTAQAAYGLRV